MSLAPALFTASASKYSLYTLYILDYFLLLILLSSFQNVGRSEKYSSKCKNAGLKQARKKCYANFKTCIIFQIKIWHKEDAGIIADFTNIRSFI